MSEQLAYAKINLALVVGPTRPDGKHEVTTVLQRIDLADRIRLERSAGLAVEGFEDDTLVRRALELIAGEAGVEPSWRAFIDKQIPVAAGLGGGSSDAAAALELANETARATSWRTRASTSSPPTSAPTFRSSWRGARSSARETEPSLTAIELPQAFTVLLLVPDGGIERLDRRRLRRRSTPAAGRPATRADAAALLEALAAGDLGCPAAERPRSLAARGRAAPARRLPRRRQRGRAGRLRAVRRRVVRRGREAPDRGARARLDRAASVVGWARERHSSRDSSRAAFGARSVVVRTAPEDRARDRRARGDLRRFRQRLLPAGR